MLAQEEEKEDKNFLGFGIGMIASIAEEDDWGINSRFIWELSSRGSLEVEYNNYFDRQDLKSMGEYSLNYHWKFLLKRKFCLYLIFGYLSNNYDWDRDACRSCWAIRRATWNHGLNGGLGFVLHTRGPSALFAEVRSKSIGSRYAIAILGMNRFLSSTN
ncbi:MAG: hypothetical protein AAF696_20395 [Bacteroidota bacterium]